THTPSPRPKTITPPVPLPPAPKHISSTPTPLDIAKTSPLAQRPTLPSLPATPSYLPPPAIISSITPPTSLTSSPPTATSLFALSSLISVGQAIIAVIALIGVITILSLAKGQNPLNRGASQLTGSDEILEQILGAQSSEFPKLAVNIEGIFNQNAFFRQNIAVDNDALITANVSLGGQLAYTAGPSLSATDTNLISSGGIYVGDTSTFGISNIGAASFFTATTGALTSTGTTALGDGGDPITLNGQTVSLTAGQTLILSADQTGSNYIYLDAEVDEPALFFTSSDTNNPGVRVNPDTNQLEYRNQNSTTWIPLDSLNDSVTVPPQLLTDGGTYLYPTGRESFRIYDSTGTDYIDIAHNGTNVLITTNGTSAISFDNNVNISGTLTVPTINATSINSSTLTSNSIIVPDGGLLDLSAIAHDDTASQGLRLPISTALSPPSGGAGYIAWDSANSRVVTFNGTNWTNISGASTTLQEAYEAGNTIQLSAPEGNLQISNDSGDQILFLDEATGYIGIGDITPASLFSVGSGDLFQINNSGNIIAIGGTASNLSFSGGNLSLASSGNLLFDDATMLAPVPLTLTDTALNPFLTPSIIDAINDIYDIAFAASNNSPFTRLNGSIVPYNAWESLILGSNATPSATFHVNALTGDLTLGGYLLTDSLYLRDSAQDNTLQILTSQDLTLDHTLTLNVNDGDRILSLYEDFTVGDGFSGTLTYSAAAKTLTIAESSTIDQELISTASPSWYGATLGNITIGIADDQTITTTAGNLILDSDGGLISLTDATTIEGLLTVNNNATISGTLGFGPLLQSDVPTCSPSTEGTMFYNADTQQYYYCNGTTWQSVAMGGATQWTLNTTPNPDVLHPNLVTTDLAIGGTDSSAPFFVSAASGDVTGGTYNNLTFTPPATGATLTLADGKTFTVNNTLTLSATDSDSWTFPAATAGTGTVVGVAEAQTLTNKTLTDATNILGGVTMTLGADAQGDIYYRNASGQLTRLGLGGEGYVLTASSGLPTWTASSVINYFSQVDNLIYPTEYWTDSLALGGTSTASATFYAEGETGNVVSTGTLTADSLFIRDTNQSNTLNLVWNENDTSDLTLNLALGGASRSLTLNEDLTIGDGFSGTLTYSASGKTLTVAESSTIDQELQSTTASPTWLGATLGNLQVGVTDNQTLDTTSGDLILDSASGLLVFKDNALFEGSATISGTLALASGVPVSSILDSVTGSSSTTLLTENAIVNYVSAQVGGVSYWGQSDNLLYPMEYWTDSLALGGTSTASATFYAEGETGNVVSTGTLTADSLFIRDTNQSNTLNLVWNENDTSDLTLNLALGGASRSLTLNEDLTIGDGFSGTLTYSASGKTLTVEDDAVVNQDLTTDATPTFGNLLLDTSGELRLTDGTGSYYTGFVAPADLDGTQNYVYTLPSSFPLASGYVLSGTDTGVISWVDPTTLGTNYWTLENEQLYPNNALWHDVLVGGTSTASATIALQAATGAITANQLTIDNLFLDGNLLTTTAGDLVLDSASGLISAKDNVLFEGSATISGLLSAQGGVTLSLGTLLDLSAITHNTTDIQGLKLPQGSSLTAIAGGSEGYLAYNTTTKEVMVFNGSTWSNISGASTTLQQAYTNSTDPEITLDDTRGALTLLDAATPLGANLFEVQNNDRTETYFSVDASGLYTLGSATISGMLTLSEGVSVNDISNDTTLSDASQLALVTEYAVKNYVDTQISNSTYFAQSDNLIYPSEYWADSLALGGTSTASATFYAEGETGNVISQGTMTADSFYLRDTNQSNTLNLVWNEDDTSDLTLNLLLGGASRSLTFNEDLTIGDGFSGTLTYSASGKTLTVAESSTIDQELQSTTASPTWLGATLGNLQVGVTDDQTLDTTSGDLILDSASGLLVFKDNAMFEGSATISGTLTLASGVGVSSILDSVTGSSSTTLLTENAIVNYVSAQVGGVSYWGQSDNLIYPSEYWADSLALGGTSTASATFYAEGETGNVISQGTMTADSFYLRDTNQSNTLNLVWNEDDTSDLTLNLLLGGASRSLTFNEDLTIGDGFSGTLTYSASGKTLTVEDDAVVNQDLTTDATPTFANLMLNTSGELRLTDGTGSYYAGFKAPADLTGTQNYLYTLPDDYGGDGQVLTSNSAGVLSWTTITPGDPSLWQVSQAALSPAISSYDLLVGGTSTASALFRVAGTEIATGSLMDITSSTITTGTVADLSASALTSGTLLNLSSTSTALTSGSLLSLDWSPTSWATASGDLFSLNLGTYGDLTGNLFRISNKGSDVFKVSTSQITSSLPHAFTAAGDVSLAYDLVFTNQTIASINSYGPLSIVAGESFESNNLTLTSYNSGNILLNTGATAGKVGIGAGITPQGLFHVSNTSTSTMGKALAIFDQDESQPILTASASGTTRMVLTHEGKLGLGTTTPGSILDVTQASTATASAFIANTYDVGTSDGSALAIKLGSDADNPEATDRFVNFMRGDGLIVGSISGNGSGAITYNSNGVDFAEYFKKANSNDSLPSGTLVCQGDGGVTACTTSSTQIIGVVSSNPAFVGGGDRAGDNNYVLVGLVGQVPLRVSTENGSIVSGDPLTFSSQAGTAAKATAASRIVGYAQAPFTNATPGSILITLSVGWHEPQPILTAGGDLNLSGNANIQGTLMVAGRDVLAELTDLDIRLGSLSNDVSNLSATLDQTSGQIAAITSQLNNLSTQTLGVGVAAPASGSGKLVDTSSGAYLSESGIWTNVSDAAKKANFTPLDQDLILEKIKNLPITRWNYLTDSAGITHIGPTSQDFYSAFSVGDNNTTISSLDPAGVALVGIQALAAKQSHT
ncbi:MAG: hypothetical protein PHQ43_06060, partial [Dehalococcoidales bacterium]|nr:hypothetical protein [Dehalococcoidales bacterium]